MYKTFRIIFACAAAAAAAASVFLGIFLGIVPFFCCVIGAVFFFAMSMLFKFLQEDKEKNNAPETPEIPSVGEAAERADETNGADETSGADETDGGDTDAPNAADADGAPAEGVNDGSDDTAENANEPRSEKTDE